MAYLWKLHCHPQIIIQFFLVFLFTSYFHVLSAQKDPYKVLGLSRGASNNEIRKEYKRLAMKWHPDKNPSKLAKERFIEEKNASELKCKTMTRFKLLDSWGKRGLQVQGAYEILSDPEKKRQHDIYGDSQHSQGGAGHGGHRGGASGYRSNFYHNFQQHYQPPPPEPMKSITVTLTGANFATTVLTSKKPWLVQVYSVWSSGESMLFARTWEAIAEELEGVVKCGRVEANRDSQLAATLSERDYFGRPSYKEGLPALLAFPEECSSLECIMRYRGSRTKKSVIHFVSRRLLRLPFVRIISHDKVDSYLSSAPAHKVKLLLFYDRSKKLPLLFRLAARDFRKYFSFAAVIYSSKSEVAKRYGVRTKPTLVIIKEPGVAPIVQKGLYKKLIEGYWGLEWRTVCQRKICCGNSWKSTNTIELDGEIDLVQLHSVSQQDFSCHLGSFSKLRDNSRRKPGFCAILVGQPSPSLENTKTEMREVQNFLETSSGASGSTFRSGLLRLVWLNARKQGPYCRSLLYHNPSSRAVCGNSFWPSSFFWRTNSSPPILLLVRVQRISKNYNSDDVVKHVAFYTEPLNATQISRWLAVMIANSQQEAYYPGFIKHNKSEPSLKREAWERPDWVPKFFFLAEELLERAGFSLEDLQENDWLFSYQMIPPSIALLVIFLLSHCLGKLGRIPEGGREGMGNNFQEEDNPRGENENSDEEVENLPHDHENRKSERTGNRLRGQETETGDREGEGEMYPSGRSSSSSTGSQIRQNLQLSSGEIVKLEPGVERSLSQSAYIVVLVFQGRKFPRSQSGPESDNFKATNEDFDLVFDEFKKVERNFIGEHKLQFAVANSHPDWAIFNQCERNESTNGASENSETFLYKTSKLLLWHPRRNKYQDLGVFHGGRIERIISQIEQVLDGTGNWMTAKWPTS